MSDRRFGDWIQTFTGKRFFPMDPLPEEVCIEDIAHSLSLQCRFGGHCRVFYSVGEHCVRASHLPGLIPNPHSCLAALLHDASEAYLVDVPRPIKVWLAGYREIEARVQATIFERFGLPITAGEWSEVKRVDDVLLATEARDLMRTHEARWDLRSQPMTEKIVPWTAEQAESNYLKRCADLTEACRVGGDRG